LVTLVAVVAVVGFSVVRQFTQGRVRQLVGPSVLAVATGTLLLWAQQYFYFGKSYFPVPWSHPGLAIKRLAGMGWVVTLRWNDLWGLWSQSSTRTQTVVDGIAPLAFLTFVLFVATLARRVKLGRVSQRFITGTTSLCGVLTTSFLIAYVVWMACHGVAVRYFALPQSFWSGVVDLTFVALAAVLITRAGVLARRTGGRNEIILVEARLD
jgi:hypothetical protein